MLLLIYKNPCSLYIDAVINASKNDTTECMASYRMDMCIERIKKMVVLHFMVNGQAIAIA